MRTIEQIDLSKIDIAADPIEGRKLPGPKATQQMAKSILELGQLQPIGLNETEGGRYIVIFGRRRFLAVKSLKRETIDAMILNLDDADTEAAGVAENLLRTNLNKVQLSQAMDKWVRYQEKKRLSKAGAAAGLDQILEPKSPDELIAEGAASPKPKAKPKTQRLDQVLATTTGMSPATARRQIQVAKSLTTEQLAKLEHRDDLKEKDLVGLAQLPAEDRTVAVEKLAAGEATSVIAKKSGAAAQTDAQWLAMMDGGIRGKLGRNKAFDASALLYRHTVDARHILHKTIKPALDAARADVVDNPLTRNLAGIIQLAHPRDWQLCGNCNGHGDVETDSGKKVPCPVCRRCGFKVTTDKTKEL